MTINVAYRPLAFVLLSDTLTLWHALSDAVIGLYNTLHSNQYGRIVPMNERPL